MAEGKKVSIMPQTTSAELTGKENIPIQTGVENKKITVEELLKEPNEKLRTLEGSLEKGFSEINDSDEDLPLLDFTINDDNSYISASKRLVTEIHDTDAFEVKLRKGDILTFNYHPASCANLITKDDGQTEAHYVRLFRNVTNLSLTYAHTFTATDNCTAFISSADADSIKINDQIAAKTNKGKIKYYTSYETGSYSGLFISNIISISAGDTIICKDSEPGISAIATDSDGWTPVLGSHAHSPKTLSWRAEENCKIKVSGNKSKTKFFIKKNSANFGDNNVIINKTFDFSEYQAEYEKTGVYNGAAELEKEGYDKDAFSLNLKKGDVLTFNYYPLAAATLMASWEKKYPYVILAHNTFSDILIQGFKFVAYCDMEAALFAVDKPSIKVNGEQPTLKDLGKCYYKYGVRDVSYGSNFISKSIGLNAGDTILVTDIDYGITTLYDVTHNILLSNTSTDPEAKKVIKDIRFTADTSCSVKVSGTIDITRIFIRRNTYINTCIGSSENTLNNIPQVLKLGDLTTVFATKYNYLLKKGIEGSEEYIYISEDCGNTFPHKIKNIVGNIVNYHIFADGTIMLCSPQKIYWTSDYKTLNLATIYDHDGSIWKPQSGRRYFYNEGLEDKVEFIDGKEIFVWGDYVVDGIAPRMWYTTDRGRTIKCAALMGTTDIDGKPRAIRHFHRIDYRKEDQTFYITTGDAGDECMLMTAKYNFDTDKWTFKVLNAGDAYKFGTIMIDDTPFAYLLTDYTHPSLVDKKGIYRVPLSDLNGTIDKFRRIYKADKSDWGNIALSVFITDGKTSVILPDYLGIGVLWIATKGFNFKKVQVDPKYLLSSVIGPNYNGDIYCTYYRNSGELNDPTKLAIDMGSYNLTEALRKNGLDDFMMNKAIFNIRGVSE